MNECQGFAVALSLSLFAFCITMGLVQLAQDWWRVHH